MDETTKRVYSPPKIVRVELDPVQALSSCQAGATTLADKDPLGGCIHATVNTPIGPIDVDCRQVSPTAPYSPARNLVGAS